MAVIVHPVAGVQRHFNGHAVFFRVQHLVLAPAFLRKHHLLVYGVHKGFYVGALLFIRHQDSLGRGRDHHVLQPHGQDRDAQFIENMDVAAGFIQPGVPQHVLLHGFRQGVPGAQVFPFPGKPHHGNIRFMFHYRIVKGNFGQGIVAAEQVRVIRIGKQLPGPFQHVGNFVGKHAAVPQAALVNILLCRGGVRFFFKGGNFGNRIFRFRNDIAVFFTGVRGMDAHQHQVGRALLGQLPQLVKGGKIPFVHIGIHRAHHHRFLFRNALYVMQIRRRQGDGRKGIPPAGFHADTHVFPKLVMNRGHLRLAGGNRNRCVRICRFDLTENALRHGFVGFIR